MNQLNAADNPTLATQIIEQVMAEVSDPEQEGSAPVELLGPDDLVFDLPCGHLSITGDLAREAEIRELTGRDEEKLSRLKSPDKILQEVLMLGTKRIGKDKPTEEVLDQVLSGDRDTLLIRIFAATFGPEITMRPYCLTCEKVVERTINLLTDVPQRSMQSPYDRQVSVETSRGLVIADLPTGGVQRRMMDAANKSIAELSSVLLSETVTEINGMPILSKEQVRDLPIRDCRKIAETILKASPGPQLQEVTVRCDCDAELEVPLSLAGLFQFP